MEKEKNRVGAVILNYSTFEDTIRLVGELQNQTIADVLQIVVVDNYSPNESYEKLKPLEKEYNNVVVIQADANLGYAKGNNFGLKYLEENNTPEYVAILNNDVSLPNDCFEKLIQRYEILDNPGVIAPVMVDEKGNRSSMIGKLGSTWDDFKILFALYNKLSKSVKNKEIDDTGHEAMHTEMIGGSFMFVNFEKFKQMGYFYPNTFLYGEERFIADSAKRLGFNNYVLLDQTYIHAHNSPTISSYHNQVAKYKLLYTSRLEFIRVCKKHGQLKANLLRPFMWWSLLEWRVIGFVKSKRNRKC